LTQIKAASTSHPDKCFTHGEWIGSARL
jgi:hypothetical protein